MTTEAKVGAFVIACLTDPDRYRHLSVQRRVRMVGAYLIGPICATPAGLIPESMFCSEASRPAKLRRCGPGRRTRRGLRFCSNSKREYR